MARILAPAARRLRSALGAPATPGTTVPLGGRAVPLSHPLFQIDAAMVEASRAAQRRPVAKIESATWFVPWFRHLGFGGIQTIFRLMSGFAAQGIATRAVIYDRPGVDVAALKQEVVAAFPGLAGTDFSSFDMDNDRVEDLPATDAAFCTFWASAYVLLRFNQAAAKYYLVQDYEPLFYLAGPTYALAESTYRFGFAGIVNTPGLLDALRERHGVEGVSFVPAVDGRHYFPPSEPRSNERVRVFFYARPGQERNCFELGLLVIGELLERYGDAVEIVTAGAVWDESSYGLGGRITNLGLLDGPQAVGELYRTCDLGFVYSLSKHPSYQPFEFMASGMAAVVNRNEDTTWFLEDGANCLLAEPSPKAMAEQIGRLIEDPALRAAIAERGIASVGDSWDAEVAKVLAYVSG